VAVRCALRRTYESRGRSYGRLRPAHQVRIAGTGPSLQTGGLAAVTRSLAWLILFYFSNPHRHRSDSADNIRLGWVPKMPDLAPRLWTRD
jgi:hypothetical protein